MMVLPPRGGVLLAVLGVAAVAGSPAARAVEVAPYPVGPFNLYPSMGVTESYVDNYFWTSGNEQSTWLSVLTPRLDAVLDGGRSRYSLSYLGEIGRPHSFQTGDYSDHRLLGDAMWRFSSRLKAALDAEYLQDHDAVGTEGTEGVAAAALAGREPDQWHGQRGGGVLTYGAPEADGQLELAGGYLAKTYDNHRASTRFRDRDDRDLRGTFYWRVAPKTRALFEVRHKDIDYDRDAAGVPTLDSQELWYYTGATWEATGRTTGAVRLGRVERNYDAGARKDSADFAWEIDVTWKPRTYSVFKLATSRTPYETNNGLTDDGYLSDAITLDWTHDWQPRIQSVLDLRVARDNYQGSGREDDVVGAGLQVKYQARRWLEFGAGYVYTEKDSSIGVFDYDRNVWMLSLNASL